MTLSLNPGNQRFHFFETQRAQLPLLADLLARHVTAMYAQAGCASMWFGMPTNLRLLMFHHGLAPLQRSVAQMAWKWDCSNTGSKVRTQSLRAFAESYWQTFEYRDAIVQHRAKRSWVLVLMYS